MKRIITVTGLVLSTICGGVMAAEAAAPSQAAVGERLPLEQLVGSYEMDGGQILRVARAGGGLQARFGEADWQSLRQRPDGQWVSADASMELRFRGGDAGQTGVQLTLPQGKKQLSSVTKLAK